MENNLKELLGRIQNNKFDLIETISYPLSCSENIINTIDSTEQFCVVKSAEGKLSTVENKNDLKDWGKNNSFFPFHLDGAYYLNVPHYVILYCLRPSTKGGNTFFTKAEDVIRNLENKYDNNILNSLDIVYISPDKKKYKRPLIESVEGGKQLNWFSSLYIEPNLNRISDHHRRSITKHIAEVMQDIEHHLYENIILNHQWKEGDLVLFNNKRLLHGREKILEEGNRLLYRIWIDKKDFLEVKNPIN